MVLAKRRGGRCAPLYCTYNSHWTVIVAKNSKKIRKIYKYILYGTLVCSSVRSDNWIGWTNSCVTWVFNEIGRHNSDFFASQFSVKGESGSSGRVCAVMCDQQDQHIIVMRANRESEEKGGKSRKRRWKNVE